MKTIPAEEADDIAGGLDLRQSELQMAPEPQPADPLVVVDYNPPVQPQ